MVWACPSGRRSRGRPRTRWRDYISRYIPRVAGGSGWEQVPSVLTDDIAAPAIWTPISGGNKTKQNDFYGHGEKLRIPYRGFHVRFFAIFCKKEKRKFLPFPFTFVYNKFIASVILNVSTTLKFIQLIFTFNWVYVSKTPVWYHS